MPEEEIFDWDAFMRDTVDLSAAATGAWIRCLYKMRLSVTRGRISRPTVGYARLFGCNVEQAKALIDEIVGYGVGDAETESNGDITLTNRRMFREWHSQESNRIRQLRYQEKKRSGVKPKSNGHITKKSQTRHSSSSKSSDEELDTTKRKTRKDVELIFRYWQETLGHSRSLLTAERERAIHNRLKEGYSVGDLKRAIDGCKASPYHNGVNETGAIYHGIDLICRNGSNVERFIGYLDGRPPQRSQVGKSKEDFPEPECSMCFDQGFVSEPDPEGPYSFSLKDVPCPKCKARPEIYQKSA